MYQYFFFPLVIFFSVSHHLQFFFGFLLENIIFLSHHSCELVGNGGKTYFLVGKSGCAMGIHSKFPTNFPAISQWEKKTPVPPLPSVAPPCPHDTGTPALPPRCLLVTESPPHAPCPSCPSSPSVPRRCLCPLRQCPPHTRSTTKLRGNYN